jgi:hypothetical protein
MNWFTIIMFSISLIIYLIIPISLIIMLPFIFYEIFLIIKDSWFCFKVKKKRGGKDDF